MGHKERVDTIHIGDGSVGQDLGISLGFSLSIEVSVSLAGQVLYCGVVVGSVERSYCSVEMVDQLWVSLSFSLTVMSKPESQVVVSSSKVGVVYRGDCSTKVTNKLTVRGGGKAAQDQKFHGDFWS